LKYNIYNLLSQKENGVAEENVLILVKKETRKRLKIMAAEREMTVIDLVELLVSKEEEKEEKNRG
jgi:hypothetical protein